jgi:hypothetical protein
MTNAFMMKEWQMRQRIGPGGAYAPGKVGEAIKDG